MKNKECPVCKTQNPIEANFCRHCCFEFPEPSKKGGTLKPIINSVNIAETEYCEGSKIRIYIDVDNCVSLSINGEAKANKTFLEYRVGKERTLKLEAKNDYATATKVLTLSPMPKAQIVYYGCNKNSVFAGDIVSINWKVDNARKLVLKYGDNEVDVTDKQNLRMNVDRSTKYTLKAYSVDELFFDERDIEVRVCGKVNVEEFNIDNNSIVESMPVKLTWKVKNADKLTLLPLNQDVTGREELTIFPKSSVEYVLVATNELSTEKAYLPLYVSQLPKIDVEFKSDFSEISIPDLSLELTSLLNTIEETSIDKWMMTPNNMSVWKSIWKNSIMQKLQSILEKDINEEKK